MFRGRVRHVHFVGVGGIGMSGLAEILRTLEFDVSGSDLKRGRKHRPASKRLGVRIDVGHRARERPGRGRGRLLERDRTRQPRDARGARAGIPVIRAPRCWPS